MEVSISNSTKNSLPFGKLFFTSIKNEILDKKYDLSVAIVGDKKSASLNKKYRNKDYTPNILSFPLDEENGEIFLNLKQSKKEFNKFYMTYKEYITFLFIHGCLHLKGLDHGNEMEALEKKYLKKFYK